MILHALAAAPDAPQVDGWLVRDGEDLLILREYADGRHTFERKAGCTHWTGEAEMTRDPAFESRATS